MSRNTWGSPFQQRLYCPKCQQSCSWKSLSQGCTLLSTSHIVLGQNLLCMQLAHANLVREPWKVEYLIHNVIHLAQETRIPLICSSENDDASECAGFNAMVSCPARSMALAWGSGLKQYLPSSHPPAHPCPKQLRDLLTTRNYPAFQILTIRNLPEAGALGNLCPPTDIEQQLILRCSTVYWLPRQQQDKGWLARRIHAELGFLLQNIQVNIHCYTDTICKISATPAIYFSY